MILIEKLIQQTSKTPLPFPGEYPTRVAIFSEGKVPFKYVGKPVPGLLKYFQRNYVVKKGSSKGVSFHEVDLNGVVRFKINGDRPFQVSFADLYYPLFPGWQDATSFATLFALLGREPVTVAKRHGYRCSFMDDCAAREHLDRMLQYSLKGRLSGNWFEEGATIALQEFLDKKTQNFLDSVFGVERRKTEKIYNARVRRAGEGMIRLGPGGLLARFTRRTAGGGPPTAITIPALVPRREIRNPITRTTTIVQPVPTAVGPVPPDTPLIDEVAAFRLQHAAAQNAEFQRLRQQAQGVEEARFNTMLGRPWNTDNAEGW